MSIVIFSREIHSGKTTELFNWVQEKQNVAGILMPDRQGRRMFYDIAKGIYFPADAVQQTAETIAVGSYFFDAGAFDKANSVIEKAALDPRALIVIDEVGKLEMEDRGFSRTLTTLVADNRDLLIVVRDSLIDAVSDKFGMSPRIITSMKDY
jgi:nucleoside-triphosphatase THEP1